jgi:alcohol dehydrogenase YqhD (iron-dependent ADH family)
MRFEFATPQRIIFGPGSLKELGGLAASMGRRALLAVGMDPRRAEGPTRLLA